MVDFVKLKDDDNGGAGRKRSSSRISFKKIFLIGLFFFLLSSFFTTLSYTLSPKIAVVPLKGTIMTEKSTSLFENAVSSRDIANKLDDIGDDDSVKAVLIDINSPGGSPVASDEISRAIDRLKEKKPVYALINDVGASGAFWVAVSADKIYASSMSTVGSIGVTSAGLSFENFIKQYNVTYRKLTSGKYKDVGSIFREPTEEEKEMIQNILDDVHYKFISHIAEERNMSIDKVKAYAEGEIFLGDKAKEIGFVDEIGYYPDAIEGLKKDVGNDDLMVVVYKDEPTVLEALGVKSISSVVPKSAISLE